MGIEKRVQLIMASNRLTAASFADRIGVQRSNVSHVLNGRNKPGYEFIVKVIKAFPNVSSHWLLTGEDAAVTGATTDLFNTPEVENTNVSTRIDTNVIIGNDTNVHPNPASKRVIKTIVFYDDFTFDAFVPNEQ